MTSVGLGIYRGVFKQDIPLPEERGCRPCVLLKGTGNNLVTRTEGVQEVFDILGY